MRDELMGRTPKDFDVATSATPEQVRAEFRNARIIGRRFKLVHVHFGREIIEVATFRAHHPEGQDDGDSRASSNESGRILRDNVYGSLEDDAQRRDFTINALYFDVTLAACSSRTEGRSPFTDPPPAPGQSSTEDPIRVEIQNLSFNDITVWAVRSGGQRTRIARVTGKTDTTVTIGWNVAVPVSFFIEQTAGRSCSTAQIGVEAQARVWVQVPSNVGRQPCRAGRR